MSILYTLIANGLALFFASQILDGLTFTGGIPTYLIVAALISLLNLILKPILKVLSFPLIFFTGGLFLIVINALILYLAQYLLTVMDFTGLSMSVDKPLTYLLAAAIFGVANWLIHWFLKDE
ncbi:phage holin family protein [Candidatus Peregrinibacteria bacterium]|nr:MAG: phage holin family protein [Candidatus Peregrinibacteria bacterium]